MKAIAKYEILFLLAAMMLSMVSGAECSAGSGSKIKDKAVRAEGSLTDRSSRSRKDRMAREDFSQDNGIKVEKSDVICNDSTFVLKMSLNIDSLSMHTNRRLVLRVLVSDMKDSLSLPCIVINGRNSQVIWDRIEHKDFPSSAMAVRRRNGEPQTIEYSAVTESAVWMRNSNVSLIEDKCGCGRLMESNDTIIKRLRSPLVAYLRPDAEPRKTRYLELRTYIEFPVNETRLDPFYRNNQDELSKIAATVNLIREDANTVITGIEIHGYASPEDTWRHNSYLAESRTETLKDYVAETLGLDDSLFTVDFTPEDWKGLEEYVSTSWSLQYRDEILEIIADETQDVDAREHAIKYGYPSDYRILLDECYPALRHSDCKVTYSVRDFSIDESKELLYTKPQLLSLEEMYLVAQTYEPGSRDFNNVFGIAVRLFPDDETANLNAACARMQAGDADGAEEYLQKAGNSAYAVHARGVFYMLRGDYEAARICFHEAVLAGIPEAVENMRLLDME